MPLYTYFCSTCDKMYEVEVPLAKWDSKIKCPYCKKSLKKMLDAPMIKVK